VAVHQYAIVYGARDVDHQYRRAPGQTQDLNPGARQRLGFGYSSDTRGSHPFLPTCNAEMWAAEGPMSTRAGTTDDNIKYGWTYALLLAEGPSDLDNVPRIRDVETRLEILVDLGCAVEWTAANAVRVDSRGAQAKPLDPRLCARIRASILLAGPMLARFGRVTLPPPGGDDVYLFGDRADYVGIPMQIESVSNDAATGGDFARAGRLKFRRLMDVGRRLQESCSPIGANVACLRAKPPRRIFSTGGQSADVVTESSTRSPREG